MAEKIDGWNPTCKRFVAFLDIMGFRERVFRESHEEVKKMLESLLPAIGFIENYAKEWTDTKRVQEVRKIDSSFTPHIVFPVLFSDSIILISSDDSESSMNEMAFNAGWILSKAILSGIPMKGAIACGEQTAILERSLYFGKPLIDAFDLQNELQLYGVVLHHTLEKHLKALKIIDKFENIIFNYLVPTKNGKITHRLVDWTIHSNRERRDPQTTVTDLYNNVSGSPRKYVDNTLEFLEWLKKERETQKKKS
jgi:hypothetical protein